MKSGWTFMEAPPSRKLELRAPWREREGVLRSCGEGRGSCVTRLAEKLQRKETQGQQAHP